MISFESLSPESIIFELRYEQGYLYWDNCGKIYKEIAENWKGIGIEDVSIQEANIQFREKKIKVRYTPQLLNISLANSTDVKFMGEFADSVVKTICKYLDIDVFNRVGNRFQFMKPLDSPDDFSQVFSRVKLLNIPEAISSKVGETVRNQEVKFSIEREEEFGYYFRFTQFSRGITVELPDTVSMDTSKFIDKGILFDLDIYTLKPVTLSSLSCGELLRKNIKDYEFIIKEFI